MNIPFSFGVTDVAVMVNVRHSKASDLRITLTDPNNITYVLSEYNGSSDAINGFPYPDFRYTIFDNDPSTPLGAGIPGTAIDDPGNNSPLFRGIYSPESNLPTTGNGQGTWTLEVYDNFAGDVGELVSWGLIFNRYNSYKDFRTGWTIDDASISFTDRYDPPFVDDITPVPPYMVHGYRPETSQLRGHYLLQNGKVQSATALNVSYYDPNMNLTNIYLGDFLLPNADQFYFSGAIANINKAGTYKFMFNGAQRSDLYMTRPDNTATMDVIVTPGSLGFDNGVASTTTDISLRQDECTGSTYTIYDNQIITSVDIYQTDAVELEPSPTPGYATIRVYDNSFTLKHTFGPYDLPKQGNKWVSYPVPPTVLVAGTYTIALCVENVPQVGGTGMGVDLQGSPFATGGAIQRYYGHGLQWWSSDMGSSWNEEYSSLYGTKMIRPNFILDHSDVGVVAFAAPTGNIISGSVTPQVTFGSFANNPHLPNLLTVGKLSVINNTTKQTVYYSERRIFFQPASFETTISFDNLNLTTGSYTLRAEVWRADDENDINNVYERQYTVSSAPVVISYNSKITVKQLDQIKAQLLEQGYEVETFDRTFAPFEFPRNGHVVWAGEISASESGQIRDFVETGNFFAVVPSENNQSDIRTAIFEEIANSQELESIDMVMNKAARFTPPPVSNKMVDYILGGGEGLDFLKSANMDSRNEEFRAYVRDMQSRRRAAGELDRTPQDRHRRPVYRGSNEIDVQGTRLGNLAVARIVPAVTKTASEAPVIIALDETGFDLAQNYPNPFNPSTTIQYNVVTDAQVSIGIYDMLGRKVATLVNSIQSGGIHTVVWNSTNNAGVQAASGMYMYRMEATPLDGSTPSVMTKTMVLAR
jgi:hypothetical protein